MKKGYLVLLGLMLVGCSSGGGDESSSFEMGSEWVVESSSTYTILKERMTQDDYTNLLNQITTIGYSMRVDYTNKMGDTIVSQTYEISKMNVEDKSYDSRFYRTADGQFRSGTIIKDFVKYSYTANDGNWKVASNFDASQVNEYFEGFTSTFAEGYFRFTDVSVATYNEETGVYSYNYATETKEIFIEMLMDKNGIYSETVKLDYIDDPDDYETTYTISNFEICAPGIGAPLEYAE